jgi:hypothetical protein
MELTCISTWVCPPPLPRSHAARRSASVVGAKGSDGAGAALLRREAIDAVSTLIASSDSASDNRGRSGFQGELPREDDDGPEDVAPGTRAALNRDASMVMGGGRSGCSPSISASFSGVSASGRRSPRAAPLRKCTNKQNCRAVSLPLVAPDSVQARAMMGAGRTEQ